MKPVYMSKFGIGEGNCLTACVASLLECEISDIPDFSAKDKEWHKFTVNYMRQRGLLTIFVPVEVMPSLIVSDCLCIAIFGTDSPESHAKLGRWHSEWNHELNTWRYQVDEVLDPNPHGTEVGDLQSLFLVMQPVGGSR